MNRRKIWPIIEFIFALTLLVCYFVCNWQEATADLADPNTSQAGWGLMMLIAGLPLYGLPIILFIIAACLNLYNKSLAARRIEIVISIAIILSFFKFLVFSDNLAVLMLLIGVLASTPTTLKIIMLIAIALRSLSKGGSDV